MCKCTPSIKTPYCGKFGCQWPKQKEPAPKQFEYELCTQEEVKDHIRNCEGKHVQQAVYSTFMDTLTQICFTCQKIRGSVKWEGNRSWRDK